MREKHDTGWNRYQLDQVEQALQIQFPDDEIRHHDDRAGKYHNNILGGAADVEDDQVTGAEEEPENNDGDLDALAAAQEEAKVLVSLATANRTLREGRDKRINQRYCSATLHRNQKRQ